MEVADNPFSHYTGSSNPFAGNTSCIDWVTAYVRWKLELCKGNLHLGTLFLDTEVCHLGKRSNFVDNHLKFVACHEIPSFPNLLAGYSLSIPVIVIVMVAIAGELLLALSNYHIIRNAGISNRSLKVS
jgi:hypothetical protein